MYRFSNKKDKWKENVINSFIENFAKRTGCGKEYRSIILHFEKYRVNMGALGIFFQGWSMRRSEGRKSPSGVQG